MAQIIKVYDGVVVIEAADPIAHASSLIIRGKNNNGTLFLKGGDVDVGETTVFIGASTNQNNNVNLDITATGDGYINIGSELRISGDTGAPGQVLTSNGPGVKQTWQNNTGTSGYSGCSGYSGSFGTSISAVFTGNSSTLALILTNTAEVVNVLPTEATGTITYDVTSQSVLYYTANALTNWVLNFRASFGTPLNTALSVGQSITVAFLVTQGGVAYYNTALQVDGAPVVPKWQGGVAPSAGNINSIDVYSYTIIKIAPATFSILANQAKYA
jgi:hypothetical protein